MFIYKQLTKCQHFLLPNFASIIINFYEGLTRGDTRQTTKDKRHTTQDTRQRTKRMFRPAAAALVKLPKFASHVAAAVAAPEPPSCRHWNASSMYFPNHHSCQYPHSCCSFYPEQQTIYANSCTAHRTLLRRAKCKKSTRTHCRCHFNDKFQHTHTHTDAHIETLGHSGERQLNN